MIRLPRLLLYLSALGVGGALTSYALDPSLTWPQAVAAIVSGIVVAVGFILEWRAIRQPPSRE